MSSAWMTFLQNSEEIVLYEINKIITIINKECQYFEKCLSSTGFYPGFSEQLGDLDWENKIHYSEVYYVVFEAS
jgi:hypothetical protein